MADATSGVRQASTRQLTRQLHQGARKLDPRFSVPAWYYLGIGLLFAVSVFLL